MQETSMKFVTFEVATAIGNLKRIGILQGHNIIDLHTTYALYLKDTSGACRWRELAQAIVPTDMLRFIEGGNLSMVAIQKALEYFMEAGSPEISHDGEKLIFHITEVKLKAPVPCPLSIRDCSVFEQHVRNASASTEIPEVWYEIPAHYRTSATDVAGPDDPILWPSYTDKLDYELEFGLCIGKQGVNIPIEKAEDYIFGYTIYNDISARDIQKKEMQLKLGPAKGKSFQNSNIIGPCLVTPDEIDVNNLRLVARVNGEVWSEGNSKDMYYKFPELIAYLSKDDPLYPGEFIFSGTVGLGSGLELNKWLKPGDVVELEVEGIGILRNKVEKHF